MSILLKTGMTAPMSTHTPGPWKQAMWDGRIAIIHDRTDNGTFDIVVACNDSAPTFADARLIAAAPDLLAACHAIFDHYDEADLMTGDIETLRAAITKATGAQS